MDSKDVKEWLEGVWDRKLKADRECRIANDLIDRIKKGGYGFRICSKCYPEKVTIIPETGLYWCDDCLELLKK